VVTKKSSVKRASDQSATLQPRQDPLHDARGAHGSSNAEQVYWRPH